MNSKARQFHSLSRRIVAQFCIFTLVLSAIYGMLAFMLLYNLEDSFIERDVAIEADYLVAQYQKSKQWPAVRSPYMSLHVTKESLPDDMRELHIAEPKRKEFYGDQGRHYHLYRFAEYDNTYLLAEVSETLLVRPVRGGVLKLLVISGLLLTLIASIIAWLLGRKTAKPLKELADLVNGVAPENIPSKFADRFPNNEIGVLARTLESSMERISKTLERERCFTRDVSHELRTPVAIIKNAVELYQEKPHEQLVSDDIINRINDASIQMEQTVTTLLHLAREEHVDAKTSSVELMPLIEQSIIDHSYLLADKAIDVEVSENCSIKLVAQQGMLKVLLDNLLSNAFQYTDSGKVSVSYTNNTLSISDTGPGIAPELSTKVTEAAVKGSQSTGYGFGLSIVKRLCEHQQWGLKVTSHQGTCISVIFT